MSQPIIKQPDGRYAVFSTYMDTFVILDATADELVEWHAQQAAEAERERVRRELDRIQAGGSPAITWEKACDRNVRHGGDLTPHG